VLDAICLPGHLRTPVPDGLALILALFADVERDDPVAVEARRREWVALFS
jgi:hypothetical protein